MYENLQGNKATHIPLSVLIPRKKNRVGFAQTSDIKELTSLDACMDESEALGKFRRVATEGA